MSSTTAGCQEPSLCGKCPRTFHAIDDMQKTTGRYWTNCSVCREKHREEGRRQRGLPTKQRRVDASGLRYQERKVYTRQRARRPNLVTKPKIPRKFAHGSKTYGTSLTNGTDAAVSDDDEDFSSLINNGPSNNFSTSSETREKTPTPPPQDPECSVCSDTFPAHEFPRLRDCSHEPLVCSGCFADWLASQIDNTSWDHIECPADACDVLVVHEDMKRLASAETYMRYVALPRLATTNADFMVPGTTKSPSAASSAPCRTTVTVSTQNTPRVRSTMAATSSAAMRAG